MTLLSAGEAQRLTQRIKLTASTVRDNLFKLRNLVDEAKNSNVWNVLGFASWTAYLADTLADEPMRLGRDERQELVGYLSGEGLSTRAIAAVTGSSKNTVTADLREVSQSGTPTPEPAPAPVTGLDGKTYSRPIAKPDPAVLAAEAVEEFPDLRFYFDRGEHERVSMLATALRGYEEPELSARLNALRASVAADQRRAEPRAVPVEPDYEGLADEIFVAFNAALQAVEKLGGESTIRRAVRTASPESIDLWRSQFERIQPVAAALNEACRPALRSVK